VDTGGAEAGATVLRSAASKELHQVQLAHNHIQLDAAQRRAVARGTCR